MALLLVVLSTTSMVAQENEQPLLIVQDSVSVDNINPLSPAKAAFYSAVLPGLGQAYNKSYWKIPVVYAALGVGTYFIVDNNKKYTDFRNEYKKRLNGTADLNDAYYGRITDAKLIEAQRYHQRYRDLSILITVGIYILNIVDANVDAHLLQFNVNDNLSFHPKWEQNQMDYKGNMGVTLNYKF